MQTDRIQRDVVIKQLVSQQFFIPPDLITDRTHRLRIEIQGSDRVFHFLTDFLYEISNDLYGLDPTPYNDIMKKAGDALHFKSIIAQQRFRYKIKNFLKEDLATEDILFISTIASILEVLDSRHFDDLVDQLYDSYVKLCLQKTAIRENSNLSRHFIAGIKRLGEIADPHFSLLHNIVKCLDLARMFKIKISFDKKLVQEYNQRVVYKIISGGI